MGYIVVGNKSITAGPTLPVSVCSSSKADLMAFHPNRSAVIYINSEEPEEEPEEELVRVLKGFVTENKDRLTEANQQFFGGIEVLGDLGVCFIKRNSENPIFHYMIIYALTICHSTDTCSVKKVNINFLKSSLVTN